MKHFSKSEISRILFTIERDGIDATILFAKQTIRQYRTGVLKTRKKNKDNWSHLSLPEFKKHAILSYLQLNHFLANVDSYKQLQLIARLERSLTVK